MSNPYQGSAQWFSDRLGKLTGSRMAAGMALRQDGKESAKVSNLRLELLYERREDQIFDHFVSKEMKWGIEQEPFAREAYEVETGEIVKLCGFVDHPSIDWLGASPDGLIGRDGLVEFKCPASKTHLVYQINGVVPDDYKPQMILQMLCTGRKWCDFVSFDPRVKAKNRLFVVRFEPSEKEAGLTWLEYYNPEIIKLRNKLI